MARKAKKNDIENLPEFDDQVIFAEESRNVLDKRTSYVDNDEVKVYSDGFANNDQLSKNMRREGRRVIYIDPEVVYQMARLGMTREMVGAYWGLSKSKFISVANDYPEIEESYLMGMSAGIIKAASKLDEMVNDKQVIPTIFRMKISGFIEAEKRKDINVDTPRVNIFLPDNSRD